MCDYSLEVYARRAAKQGEVLTLQRFPSSTQGFIAAEDCATAVCLLPGTTMTVELPHEEQWLYGLTTETVVTFIKMDAKHYHDHRDGVRLENGKEISLQKLREGSKAEVIFVAPLSDKEDADLASKPDALTRLAQLGQELDAADPALTLMY